MRAKQMADGVNAELSRLGVRYAGPTTPDALVSRVEPGVTTAAGGPVLRMGGGWFSGLYDGAALLAYLRKLRPSAARAEGEVRSEAEAFWQSGEFWDHVHGFEVIEGVRHGERAVRVRGLAEAGAGPAVAGVGPVAL